MKLVEVPQGRVDDAWKLFDQMIGLIGPTGLLPEQFDPEIGRSLGNHPQAYSHIGVIENALRLARDKIGCWYNRP